MSFDFSFMGNQKITLWTVTAGIVQVDWGMGGQHESSTALFFGRSDLRIADSRWLFVQPMTICRMVCSGCNVIVSATKTLRQIGGLESFNVTLIWQLEPGAGAGLGFSFRELKVFRRSIARRQETLESMSKIFTSPFRLRKTSRVFALTLSWFSIARA